MTAARIRSLRVAPAHFAADCAYDLCNWVAIFAHVALEEKGYLRPELPPGLADFADLMAWYGEWRNGGFCGVSADFGEGDALERTAHLLAVMGEGDHAANLRRFIAFMGENTDRLDDLWESGEEEQARRLFDPYDDRFFAIERARSVPLETVLAAWLSGQPWIAVDPQAPPFTSERICAAIPDHPQAGARKEAALRERQAETAGTMAAFLHRLRQRLGKP